MCGGVLGGSRASQAVNDTCLHMSTHVYICVCINICVYIYVYICVCVLTYMHSSTGEQRTQTCTHLVVLEDPLLKVRQRLHE